MIGMDCEKDSGKSVLSSWFNDDIYIYIYIHTHTHKHTHIYTSLYIYVCVCVCVYVSVWVHDCIEYLELGRMNIYNLHSHFFASGCLNSNVCIGTHRNSCWCANTHMSRSTHIHTHIHTHTRASIHRSTLKYKGACVCVHWMAGAIPLSMWHASLIPLPIYSELAVNPPPRHFWHFENLWGTLMTATEITSVGENVELSLL